MLKEGITLIHEHTRIDLSRIKGDDDTNLNCKEATIKEFSELYDYGVRNIVDVTNMGMGRDPEYVREVAEKSGINIIQSTGFYKEPFLPDFVYDMDIDELADLIAKEIEEGIEDTGIKAQVIGEIGTSKDKIEAMEEKIFMASIKAHKKTGAIISTHTSLGTMALDQADMFIKEGVDPAKVVIGHQDLCGNLDQIKKLINLGFYVSFDTVGKNNYFPDVTRAEYLLDLQENNMLDRIFFSMDITRKSNLKYKGGIGYTYLFTDFIPLIKKSGISQESIDRILIYNPRRIFGV